MYLKRANLTSFSPICLCKPSFFMYNVNKSEYYLQILNINTFHRFFIWSQFQSSLFFSCESWSPSSVCKLAHKSALYELSAAWSSWSLEFILIQIVNKKYSLPHIKIFRNRRAQITKYKPECSTSNMTRQWYGTKEKTLNGYKTSRSRVDTVTSPMSKEKFSVKIEWLTRLDVRAKPSIM